MREIGGYIEFEHNHGEMMHEGDIALNSGRNALAYLIESRGINKISIPYFCCDSVYDICKRYGVDARYYHTNCQFQLDSIELAPSEWLYVVNYYGQLTKAYIQKLKKHYDRIIVDNSQAYFMEPLAGVDTIYSCRKFFGVPDGAFLSTDVKLARKLERSVSCEYMSFLGGRFECSASRYYQEFVNNEERFKHESVKKMSALTENILRGIDYNYVRDTRERNWSMLDNVLGSYNKLNKLHKPAGPYMYPMLIEDGGSVRKALQAEKIYIPTLWSDVFKVCKDEDIEYSLAENILPLPIDQRYSPENMRYVAERVLAHARF